MCPMRPYMMHTSSFTLLFPQYFRRAEMMSIGAAGILYLVHFSVLLVSEQPSRPMRTNSYNQE